MVMRYYLRPLQMNLELTQVCPLQCPQCYVVSGARHMERDLALQRIREAAAFGVRHINLSGGETLCYPYLSDLIRECGAEVEIERLDDHSAVLLITIREGRNRQVRKMCEQVGLKVTRLCRVSEGGVRLGDLKSGAWRELTRAEIARLKAEGENA